MRHEIILATYEQHVHMLSRHTAPHTRTHTHTRALVTHTHTHTHTHTRAHMHTWAAGQFIIPRDVHTVIVLGVDLAAYYHVRKT